MHFRNDFPSNGISICTASGNFAVGKQNRVNLVTFTWQSSSIHILHVIWLACVLDV